jgi:hypothetical protein
VAGVSLFRISARPNRLPRPCSGSGLTAWSGSCRQRITGHRPLSSVSVLGQPIARLDRCRRSQSSAAVLDFIAESYSDWVRLEAPPRSHSVRSRSDYGSWPVLVIKDQLYGRSRLVGALPGSGSQPHHQKWPRAFDCRGISM